MNEWVRDYSYNFNKIYGVENATDYNGDTHEGAIFFTGDNAVKGGQFTLDVDLRAKKYSSTDNGYHLLTAGNFNVEKSIQMMRQHLPRIPESQRVLLNMTSSIISKS